MADGYETFSMIWQERTIAVSFQANWLNSGHCHVELRCIERLPVTATGYRSIFVPDAGFVDEAAIAAFVSALLDDAAKDKTWLRYLGDSHQLTLF